MRKYQIDVFPLHIRNFKNQLSYSLPEKLSKIINMLNRETVTTFYAKRQSHNPSQEEEAPHSPMR